MAYFQPFGMRPTGQVPNQAGQMARGYSYGRPQPIRQPLQGPESPVQAPQPTAQPMAQAPHGPESPAQPQPMRPQPARISMQPPQGANDSGEPMVRPMNAQPMAQQPDNAAAMDRRRRMLMQ